MRSHTLVPALILAVAAVGLAAAAPGFDRVLASQAPAAAPAKTEPEKKADQAAPAPEKEKTAAEAFKNIQILKDIPASQLMPAMFMMAASLGVGCDFCHVTSDQGRWPMEKDDKKPKQTAREMIKMLHGINDGTFGGRTEVSCATCHQGHIHTSGLPPVLPLGVKPEQRAEAPKDLPTADSILDRYVEAIGGSAALANVKTRESTGTATGEAGRTFEAHQMQKAPNLFVTTFSSKDVTRSSGFDGKSAWQKWGAQAFVQPDIEGDRIARSGEFWIDTDVKKLYPRRVVTGIEKIGDEDAYVVRLGGPGSVGEVLYFSKASGLLLRRTVLTRTPLGRLPQETDFSDYRDVDGVKEPFTITRRELNARLTVKFTEIKHNVAVEDVVFQVPVGPS